MNFVETSRELVAVVAALSAVGGVWLGAKKLFANQVANKANETKVRNIVTRTPVTRIDLKGGPN